MANPSNDRPAPDPVRDTADCAEMEFRGSIVIDLARRDDDRPAQAVASSEALPAAPVRPPGLFARLLPGRRQRFARRVSRELQALHGTVAQTHPDLRGLDLYRTIAMERLRTSREGANALLRRADENFAWWPTTRELTFTDVVHMIAIEEYHAAYPGSAWVRADMARVIAEEVDHSL